MLNKLKILFKSYNKNRFHVKYIIIFNLMVFLFGLWPQAGKSCTTFSIKDQSGNIYFGRNFDWPIGLAHIQINQRNIPKTSFISAPEKPFFWVSKYGSITFNQCGREFPYGGMNEAGLVIEQMMLGRTKYPPKDSRYGMEELQWIQYQLDVSATVEDVINSDTLIRISYTSVAPIHFSVADANGNFATIEYINGKMVCHYGEKLKYPVLSNNTYEISLKYSKKIKDKSKISNASGNINSINRFAKAVIMIEDYNGKDNLLDYSFNILDSIAQMNTQWKIVYDIKNKRVYYKLSGNNTVKKLNMRDFDFSSDTKRIFCNMDNDIINKSAFKEYNFQDNYHLIDTVWNSLDGVLKDLPFKKEWAMYPDNVNSKLIRKFKFSAAKNITEQLMYSNSNKAQSEIQNIINAKDDYYFAEAEFLYNASNLVLMRPKKGLELLKIAAEIFPESSDVQYHLGKGYLRAKDNSMALECIERSLALDPNNKQTKWTWEWLTMTKKPAVISESAKDEMIGEFGERFIFVKNDVLYYQFQRKGNRKMKMIPLSEDIFLFKELDYYRVKIIKSNNKVTAIEGLYDDGRVYRYDKTN